MKTIRLCLAMILVLGAVPANAAANEAQVVAQDLQKLRVPGKISAVVWTRRNESYTLQVMLQMPVEYQVAMKVAQQRADRGLAPAPPATPKLLQVQAWLLKLDGTFIARSPGRRHFLQRQEPAGQGFPCCGARWTQAAPPYATSS